MHEIIRDHLEEHLRSKAASSGLLKFHAHLAECGECRDAVARMEETAIQLRTLRTSAGLELAPGFFARVMETIEAGKRPTVWSLLLDPIFGKRLVYASLTLVILLGTYMFSTEPVQIETASVPEVILSNQQREAQPSDSAETDRDVILVNLATYKE
jgi:hypothetical protein